MKWFNKIIIFLIICIFNFCQYDNKKKDGKICKTFENHFYSSKKFNVENIKRNTVKDSLLLIMKKNYKFTYTACLIQLPYKFEIETYYINDSLPMEDEYCMVNKPLIEKQKLIFKKNDTIIDCFFIKMRKMKKRNIYGEEMILLDAPIVIIFIINGIKDTILAISGSGFRQKNDPLCTEFIGYYNLDGKIIIERYANDWKKETNDSIFEKYGISELDYRRGQDKNVKINFFR